MIVLCSDTLQNMQSLEEVNLNRNGITAEGILELVNSFKSNPKLKIIILSGNALEVDGAIAIAKVSNPCPYFFFFFMKKWS